MIEALSGSMQLTSVRHCLDGTRGVLQIALAPSFRTVACGTDW